MNQSVVNWPPPMGECSDRQPRIKRDFPILFFAFQLLLRHEVILEREQTMANEDFFLPTTKSEYPCCILGLALLESPEALQGYGILSEAKKTGRRLCQSGLCLLF